MMVHMCKENIPDYSAVLLFFEINRNLNIQNVEKYRGDSRRSPRRLRNQDWSFCVENVRRQQSVDIFSSGYIVFCGHQNIKTHLYTHASTKKNQQNN